ncbi:DUF3696 domain-containing protein [Shewanella sp. WPAGA9]|uniref:DUF3696 domain-containing protein n=1 Tax=Shewanella sp. ENK2 TaxID=2775245 RepID=UPI0017862135|nr:DUF3696 domain-containing protein [Shewanella sp. WPAGA9]
MRITKLSLTNFRSFKATQTIEFAPTTLLFGPNSAGKSTILMAFFYIQHILEKGNCDPQYISALGDKFIGGFKNLVHGRDITKPIKIKIEFEKDAIGSTYFDPFDVVPNIHELDSICAHMPEVMYETNSIAVEFTIEWSRVNRQAYVSDYGVWLNNDFIAKVTCDSGMKTTLITELNFEHPLLQIEDEAFSDGEQLISLPVAIEPFSGALPKLGRALKLDVEVLHFIDKILLNDLVSDLLVAPLDNLYDILSNSVCIGPLRMIPSGQFEPSALPIQSDWYNGQAAWDKFYDAALALTHDYNYWLNDKFDLGYKLVVNIESGSNRFAVPDMKWFEAYGGSLGVAAIYKDVAGDALKMTFSKENLDENPQAKQIDIDFDLSIQDDFLGEQGAVLTGKFKGESFEFPLPDGAYLEGTKFKKRNVSLWDINNHLPVAATDVGVGISQLFPLIVAGLTQEKGFVSCEQPELHVHPRIQVEIGDFLTQANANINFMIETHSEHLILRLLRRIRETTDNELPEGITPVHAKDVSIMYIEPGDNGVVAKRIEIDEDGEFTSKWPRGFFGERREELY